MDISFFYIPSFHTIFAITKFQQISFASCPQTGIIANTYEGLIQNHRISTCYIMVTPYNYSGAGSPQLVIMYNVYIISGSDKFVNRQTHTQTQNMITIPTNINTHLDWFNPLFISQERCRVT